MLSKVEEAKSSMAASKSQNRVLNSLMAEKKKGTLPGIYGRLVSNFVLWKDDIDEGQWRNDWVYCGKEKSLWTYCKATELLTRKRKVKRINEGLHISLKLGKIFICQIVLFYVLNHLYLFFIAKPYFWPRKYLVGTFSCRQVWILVHLIYLLSLRFVAFSSINTFLLPLVTTTINRMLLIQFLIPTAYREKLEYFT